MGKYLVLWKLDNARLAIDPKERGQGFGKLLEMVRQDFENGLTKDWGAYIGEGKGFSVMEGTEVEISTQLQKYVPFCIFDVHPIMSIDQVNDMVNALRG